MDEQGVERVRIAATSAARDASNSEDFFGPAEQIVGTRPELLSGDEEGRLSFAGATADLDASRRTVPGDRHRRRVHRVHGGHRPARGGPQLRHRVRAPHREAPGERPTGRRGAQQRHRRGVGLVRRPAARGTGRRRRRRPSSGLAGTISTIGAVELGMADLRPGPDPPLPADADRHRGRVPHARHRAAGRPDPQPRARGGAGRRDRRRALRARRLRPHPRHRGAARVGERHPRRARRLAVTRVPLDGRDVASAGGRVGHDAGSAASAASTAAPTSTRCATVRSTTRCGSGTPSCDTSASRSRCPTQQVLDDSDGIPWARWFTGGRTNLADACCRPVGRGHARCRGDRVGGRGGRHPHVDLRSSCGRRPTDWRACSSSEASSPGTPSASTCRCSRRRPPR